MASQKSNNCHVLVVLKEAFAKAAGESETVCAKGQRERHIYTSRDNIVEARIVQRKQNPNPQFLIRFEGQFPGFFYVISVMWFVTFTLKFHGVVLY